MRNTTVACLAILSLGLPSFAAQTGNSQRAGSGAGQAMRGTTSGGTQTGPPPSLVVTAMPGYPNTPRLSPQQRHPVRPDSDVVVWGSLNHGDGTATGATYTWGFSHGPEVQVITDGDLAGSVNNTRFIPEIVRFELQGGATSAIVTAILQCSFGGQSAFREVEIAVVSNADPISDSDLERIEFDRQIAVESGLRYLYLSGPNGTWVTLGSSFGAGTAFPIWAFEVHGHVPINDEDEDVYATLVRKGLRHLTEASVAVVPASSHAQANVARGAALEGLADQNQNGEAIVIPVSGVRGYELPMVGSALVASLDPLREVVAGPLLGRTFVQVVEDLADRIAGGLTAGIPPNRGGWRYSILQNELSDMSVNSWMFVFLEGAESEFGVDVPDWIKQETEYTLVSHQANASGPRLFGYNGPNPVSVGVPGMATTGGGLSGLVFAETAGPFVVPGAVIETLPPPLNTIDAKRQSAISFLGTQWGSNGINKAYGAGNRGNPYTMWTVARALRLTASAANLPDGEITRLTNAGVEFDWETGYQYDSNTVAAPGTNREGYFPFLIRTQSFPGSDPAGWGYWNSTASHYSATFTTAAAILVLGRDVFLASGCDEPVAGPINMVPAPLSTYPTGESLVMSGLAVPATLDREILGVLVNGHVPQVVDAQWNFFEPITVNEGLNSYVITIIDSCSMSEFVHEFYGAEGGAIDFDNFAETSPLLEATYTNSSWIPSTGTLRFDGTACNFDPDLLRPPVVLVLEDLQPAGAVLIGADGINEDGNPFVRFSVGADGLQPSACSQPLLFQLQLGELAQVSFTPKWFAEGQLPPEITTIPVVNVQPESSYLYNAEAVDPNGTPLTWTLLAGPSGMAIDEDNGTVTWDPTPAIQASHQVRIRVSDTDGDFAEQRYSLKVTTTSNQVPFFVTLPIATGAEGVAYEYPCMALDFNNDIIVYRLLEQPLGMTIDPGTGFVSWNPTTQDGGLHAVVIEADDQNGGTALQSFTIEVAETP